MKGRAKTLLLDHSARIAENGPLEEAHWLDFPGLAEGNPRCRRSGRNSCLYDQIDKLLGAACSLSPQKRSVGFAAFLLDRRKTVET